MSCGKCSKILAFRLMNPHFLCNVNNFIPSQIRLLPQRVMALFEIYRASVSPGLGAAAFRNSSKLGLRRFSGHAGSQPSRAWTPTPYVTETVVCLSRCSMSI